MLLYKKLLVPSKRAVALVLRPRIYGSCRDVWCLWCLLSLWLSSERLYANVEELYDASPEEEEDPYSYGNESIYDSICYYQAQVSR